MRRHPVIFIVLLMAAGSAARPAAARQMPVPPQGPPTIVAQGEATVKRAADRAWLTVATETRDARAAEARRTNADLMTQVQAALRRAGVGSDALRTTGFSLVPEVEWNNGRSTLRGYIVRNQIEVRVDDLARLGDIVDAANVPRGVGLSIVGPRFALKDERAAENEALRLAVQSALSRAESMASGARRSLGPILRIEQQAMMLPGPQPVAMRMAARDVAQAETPIVPGEIEIQAHVTLTVEIR